MRHRFAVTSAAVLAASTLVGCGGPTVQAGDPATSPATTSASSPSSSPPSSPASSSPSSSPGGSPATPTSSATPTPGAARALARARRALTRADTGTFRTTATFGHATVLQSGHYRLSRKATAGDYRLTSPGSQDVHAGTVSIGQHAWFRIETSGSGTGQTCWVGSTPAEAATASGQSVAADATIGPPTAVDVVLEARGLTVSGDSISADTDLRVLAKAVNGRFAGLLGVPAGSSVRAPVTIDLSHGRVTGWHTDMVDVIKAVDAAGIPLSAELQQAEQIGPALGAITATLGRAGTPVDIVPPPTDQVVELSGDQATFSHAMKACEKR